MDAVMEAITGMEVKFTGQDFMTSAFLIRPRHGCQKSQLPRSFRRNV